MVGVTAPRRLAYALSILFGVLLVSAAFALWFGTQKIDFAALGSDALSRTLFLRLRLPRVIMAGLVGASLALSGAALQALFRNPLADSFTLGVSGGGALGASLAIALGWGARVSGIPLMFLASFGGAIAAVILVHRLARTGAVTMPGALLLSGVVINMIANAAVLAIQYVTDSTRALQILRWLIGSLDVIGYETLWRMLIFLIPSWIALLALAPDLHLLALDEETAATLGVNVRRSETAVHTLCAIMVGVTVAVGGSISFVGLIVPHAVRLLFGQDLRIVLPGSLVLGAAFLIAADAVARTAIEGAELPVGAITALCGGPMFLFLMRQRQRHSAL